MTKKAKATKATKNIEIADTIKKEVTVEQKSKQVEKRTFFYLASKANHVVEVKYNGNTTYIQPFGKIKVLKENLQINSEDAKFLTFIKI